MSDEKWARWKPGHGPLTDEEVAEMRAQVDRHKQTSTAPLGAARSVSWCRCPEVNGSEAIDWRTDKCRVCGLSVMPPRGGV